MEQPLHRNRHWAWNAPTGLLAIAEARQPVRPEMQSLTENEVLRAMYEDEEGEIAAEVTRLMCACFISFRDAIDEQGQATSDTLRVNARSPIERIAAEMTVKYIAELSKAAVH